MAGKSFHFNGVQAILSDLGLPIEQANIIANASQAVDDFYEDELIVFDDGKLFYPIVTAHKMLDADNLDSRDASNVWMPFHFFPDDDGVCKPKTQNVASLIEFVKSQLDTDSITEKEKNIYIGILFHILVDTHTHKGFIGLHCRHNDISRLDDENETNFNIFSNVAPSIGHGEAMTYPDDSWRNWSYKDSQDQVVVRNNPESFIDATKQISEVLSYFGIDSSGINETLEEKYKSIFVLKKGHEDQFDEIARENGGSQDQIAYKHWKEITLRPVQSKDNIYIKKDPTTFKDSEWFLFQMAAKNIRSFFKDQIFPELRIKTKVY
jgi:hypothetical protein